MCNHPLSGPLNNHDMQFREAETITSSLHLGFEYMVFGPAGNRRLVGFGRPRRPQTPFQKVGGFAPTFWNGFRGRRGRPDLNHRRFPACPKTMNSKPKCREAEAITSSLRADLKSGPIGPALGLRMHNGRK